VVDAGSYSAYNIWLLKGVGMFYYAPDVQNLVKIEGNVQDFIPLIDQISLDLVETTVS
jgi:hypothetical protein